MKRALLGVLAAVVLAAPVQAQEKPKIIRFEPNGPAGQGLKGDKTKSHTYYKARDNERNTAGVWEADNFSGQMRKATFTEFIYILQGSVTLAHKDGREETFKAGDAVLLPRGAEYAWKKTDNLKEYYVIFDREVAGAPAAATQGTPAFYRLDKDGPAGKGLAGEGRTKEHQYFKGADGSSVGVWETAPHTAPGFHKTRYAELMVFLKGNVTLSTPDGQQETFKAGDVALVPAGIEYKWSSDTVRKFWVIFDRDATRSTGAQQ
jgi:uncharacterized cupin superfamily protein